MTCQELSCPPGLPCTLSAPPLTQPYLSTSVHLPFLLAHLPQTRSMDCPVPQPGFTGGNSKQAGEGHVPKATLRRSEDAQPRPGPGLRPSPLPFTMLFMSSPRMLQSPRSSEVPSVLSPILWRMKPGHKAIHQALVGGPACPISRNAIREVGTFILISFLVTSSCKKLLHNLALSFSKIAWGPASRRRCTAQPYL